MDEKERKDWIEAGRVAALARDYGAGLVKKGARIREILDKVEEKIKAEGATMAFPAQISLNETAAHSCASIDDDNMLTDEVVKLDVGAMVNGAVGDTAVTIDLSGQNAELLKASKEAFEAAFKLVKPGISVSEIGKAIEQKIQSFGFEPIRNLSGHTIERFELHTHPSIPNYDSGENFKLEKGQVIAIEPFATSGVGRVKEVGLPNIFMELELKPVRNPITRQIIKEIKGFEGMPFARRWLEKKFSKGMATLALSELMRLEMIKEYKPLVEQSQGLVSQYEHTVLVLDRPIILTKSK